MYKKTVTYKDFNNDEHTEDLYFNIMAPEMADLEFNPTFEEEGGLGEYVKIAMSTGEGRKVYTFFKLMIVNSYGRRSADGATFAKNEKFTEEFLNSRAYEEFFMWLVEDPKNAEGFWNGIMPEKLIEHAAAVENKQPAGKKRKISEMTRDELVALMDDRVKDKTIEG